MDQAVQVNEAGASKESSAVGQEASANRDRTMDDTGVITVLAEMPADTLIDEVRLARIFNRHPVSIKRAIQRGELPPGVRLLGKPTWTAGVVLDHMRRRLDKAKENAERLERRIAELSI